MKAILICPGERRAVPALSRPAPLSNVVILGKPLVQYWLEHLASRGAREVYVLANDRPESVGALVGSGARWGLELKVCPELRELSAKEALTEYQHGEGWLPAPDLVNAMLHLPGFPEQPLFESYLDFVAAHEAILPRVAGPDRIGLRQVQPGVWLGLRARVSRRARLHAPCWIGDQAFIARQAVIGPLAFVEARSVVEANAEVISSIVGPDTLVGEYAALRNSIAWGSTLVNWQLNSCTEVTDSFLISSLAKSPAAHFPGWISGGLDALSHSLLEFPRSPGWDARKETSRWKFSRKTEP
ncbi:MAG TPA: hypothetical protein VMU04_08210 [Candidatus Acidoferrum sp.]|nr:hypothetical protein [Candidatus Acidoferrum sp.]